MLTRRIILLVSLILATSTSVSADPMDAADALGYSVHQALANEECYFLTQQFNNSFLSSASRRNEYKVFLSIIPGSLKQDRTSLAILALYQGAIAAFEQRPEKNFLSTIIPNIQESTNQNRDRIYLAKAILSLLKQLPKDTPQSSDVSQIIIRLCSFESPYDEIEVERLTILSALDQSGMKMLPEDLRAQVKQLQKIHQRIEGRNTNLNTRLAQFDTDVARSMKKEDYETAKNSAQQCIDYIADTLAVSTHGVKLELNRQHCIKTIPPYCTLLGLSLNGKTNANVSELLQQMSRIADQYSPLRPNAVADADVQKAIAALNDVLPKCQNKQQSGLVRRLLLLINLKTCPYNKIAEVITSYASSSSSGDELDNLVSKCSTIEFFEKTWHPEMAPAIWSIEPSAH